MGLGNLGGAGIPEADTTSAIKPASWGWEERRGMRWIISSLLNSHSCTVKLGYFWGCWSVLFVAPLWKHTGAHCESHSNNVETLQKFQQPLRQFRCERALMNSILVAKSLLENHQLLCKSIQFSGGKGLGFNFDPAVVARIFLKKKSGIVFENTSLVVCQGVVFLFCLVLKRTEWMELTDVSL